MVWYYSTLYTEKEEYELISDPAHSKRNKIHCFLLGIVDMIKKNSQLC